MLRFRQISGFGKRCLLVLAVGACACGGCSTGNNTAGRAKPEGLLKADRLCDEHKYHEAIAVLDSLIKQDSATAEALALRGRCQLAVGKLDEANDDIARAMELAPDNARVNLVRARLCQKRGQFDEAMAAVEKSLSGKKVPGEAQAIRARLLIAKELNRALDNDPQSLTANWERHFAAMRSAIDEVESRDCRSAAAFYEVAAGAFDIVTYLGFVNELCEQQRDGSQTAPLRKFRDQNRAAAKKNLEKCLELDDRHAAAHAKYAACLDPSDTERICDHLMTALECDPYNAPGLAYLIVQLWRTDILSDIEEGERLRGLLVKVGPEAQQEIRDGLADILKLQESAAFALERIAATGFRNPEAELQYMHYVQAAAFLGSVLQQIAEPSQRSM
jgi:Tfp pilus assembly protein PilF